MDTTRRKEKEEKRREKQGGVEGGWGWSTAGGGEQEVLGRPPRAALPDSQLNGNQDRSTDVGQGTERDNSVRPCCLPRVFHCVSRKHREDNSALMSRASSFCCTGPDARRPVFHKATVDTRWGTS